MSDDEALKYANDFQIAMPDLKESGPPATDSDAITQQLQQADGDAKTPKKGAPGRKRKTATPAAESSSRKGTPASPDKKRRRTSGKAAEEKEEPKKSGRKKTKSS